MSERQCSQCAALQAENAALKQEIDELKSVIAYLNALIRTVSNHCSWVIIQAYVIKSVHQPRGTWAHWGGKSEAAHEVLGLLDGR